MTSIDDHQKGNGARLSRLLIDKGTEAMRMVFDAIHPPSTLPAVLNSHKVYLQKLRCINRHQTEILFPSSGAAAMSKDFDITLLFVLLRNICGLHPPLSTGSWDMNPPAGDTSLEANLARIKYCRNNLYSHITTTGIDDVTFRSHWKNISSALISLGISPDDIDSLQFGPLEENCYLNSICEWKEKEDKIEIKLDKLEEVVMESRNEMRKAVHHVSEKDDESRCNALEQLSKLAKCDFCPDIETFNQTFHAGTRTWLLEKVDSWFRNPNCRVMVVTAGPGVGKSVFSGKVCAKFKKMGLLAACHFCKFNYSDYRNPQIMLESLSSHMCETVSGFKEKLLGHLLRRHSRHTVTDAFRVLLKEPLHALGEREPMLIVIDGLDESETSGKSELLDLIAKEFSKLPDWIKILITSRPDLPVRKKLCHLSPVEIEADDKNNHHDVKLFLHCRLASYNFHVGVINRLLYQCDGSFLYAYHVVLSISRRPQTENLTLSHVKDFVPKSIGSVYEEYFNRLRKEVEEIQVKKPSKIMFYGILEILAVARGPLPLSFVAEVLGLPADTHAMKEIIRKVNERLSALLLVYDECVTVFHKTVTDWLLSRGYDQHPYTVDSILGHKRLWSMCRNEYSKLESNKQSELRTKASDYAVQHGIDHLEWISNGNAEIPTFVGTFASDSIGVITMVHRGRIAPLGYGWIVAYQNENVFVLTTSCALRCINTSSSTKVSIQFSPKHGRHKYRVNVQENALVVSSDKGSGLDYSLFRLRTPKSVRLGKALPICKRPPRHGSALAPAGLCGGINSCCVLPHPTDLVDWLKTKKNHDATSHVPGVPVLWCDHLYDWNQVERNRENFVPHLIDIWNEIDSGFPLVNEDDQVVAMHSVSVYIGRGHQRFLIGFGICMGKIIEDVKRKNLDIARKCFPDMI